MGRHLVKLGCVYVCVCVCVCVCVRARVCARMVNRGEEFNTPGLKALLQYLLAV